ncbi:MAG: YggT family protein [Campylobacterales bacterium]
MEVGTTFLQAIVTLFDQIISLYIWVVIIAAVVSWVRADPYNPIVQLLYRLTEPVYAKIRRIMPTTFSGVDFAPIILILALQFIKLFFIKLLYGLV